MTTKGTTTLLLGISLSFIALQTPCLGQEPFGPEAGDWELTLGGTGSNDKDFDNGSFAASGSVGYYFTRALELSVRQSVSYADTEFGDSRWNGSTRLALDWHFDLGRFRPFIGGNVGGIYGDTVTDSGMAGVGAGVKFYALEKTFIFAAGEYDWFFRRADRADDQFDQGLFVYNLGIGFNF